MAFHDKQFCELTQLQYDAASKTFWGELYSFPVFLQLIPRRNAMLFRLIADAPFSEDPAVRKEKLEQWQMAHSGISALNYKERCLSCVMSLASKDSEKAAANLLSALTALAADLQWKGCCMACGSPYGYKPYLLDGGGVTVCAGCKEHLEQKMQESLNDHAMIKPNIPGVVLGAVLGAAALFLLTFFVLKLSFLSFLTSYAGVFLTLYLIKKCGRKLTKPAVVFGTALCLGVGLAAPVLDYAGIITDFNKENCVAAMEQIENIDRLRSLSESMSDAEWAAAQDAAGKHFTKAQMDDMYEQAHMILSHQSFITTLQDMPEILQMDVYSEVKVELIKCFLIIGIAIIGSAVIVATPMLKESAGIHSLRELGL